MAAQLSAERVHIAQATPACAKSRLRSSLLARRTQQYAAFAYCFSACAHWSANESTTLVGLLETCVRYCGARKPRPAPIAPVRPMGNGRSADASLGAPAETPVLSRSGL